MTDLTNVSHEHLVQIVLDSDFSHQVDLKIFHIHWIDPWTS